MIFLKYVDELLQFLILKDVLKDIIHEISL